MFANLRERKYIFSKPLDFCAVYDPYTEEEQESIKKWMLRMALDQAFDPGGEHYIYIRDCKYIPSEQIIRCERMS